MGTYDAIVIGSGIGGLGAAAALASVGKRVLVLERHTQPGGLTQAFERDGFRFDVGVHHLGGFGAGGLNRRLFDRLAGGRIEMAPIGGTYERLRFPDFDLALAPPAARLRKTLAEAFAAEAAGIDDFFHAVEDADRAMGALQATHSAPGFLATPLAWMRREAIARWVGRTTWEVVGETVRDPRLRALLCAAWGGYGTRPLDSSFAMHAAALAGHFDGAWYPAGGAGSFARELSRSIVVAGGAIRTEAEVSAIHCESRCVRALSLAGGATVDCRCLVSDIGIHNTLRLLPSDEVDYQWAADALELQPSTGHVGLYLGLEGDIAAHGADAAGHWIHETWDVNALWTDPFAQARAPSLFVAFPSLRDPRHDPGPRRRHTAEVVALVDWSAFAQWDRSQDNGGMKKNAPAAVRSDSYLAFKSLLQTNLRRQFERHFPALAPMIVMCECSTPISLATCTGAEHGASYGLEATPRRFLSAALRPRTPIGGLFLAGQDACMPGVSGALLGGLMAAANAQPRLYSLLR
jgi:all-trans-retinol 13,14-reductase